MMIKLKELINKRKTSKNNNKLLFKNLEKTVPLQKIYLKELGIMPLKSEIEDNLQETKSYLKDTLWIEEVELEECIIFFYFSDRVRKEGGGRGNIGNLKDEQHQDKYIKEGQ